MHDTPSNTIHMIHTTHTMHMIHTIHTIHNTHDTNDTNDVTNIDTDNVNARGDIVLTDGSVYEYDTMYDTYAVAPVSCNDIIGAEYITFKIKYMYLNLERYFKLFYPFLT